MLQNKLRSMGCDMNRANARFVGDADFYQKSLVAFFQDPAFIALKAALQQKNISVAMDQAMTIRSLVDSLELMPLKANAHLIVSCLYARNLHGAAQACENMMVEKNNFYQEIQKYL